ncbi:jg2420 [Pararge aegeria aegeria]|uniref:Jg2420 protein n=1 Tax=Pararge aegeria aegeria TaxID=348720 RepID=A0A8S4QVD7_9NEOP|nr:jg2420 [Pararge aegeria aegeria]
MLEASKHNAAFALIQEPYVGRIGRMRDYTGVRIFQCGKVGGSSVVKAAIAVFDNDLAVVPNSKLTTTNIAVVKIKTPAWEMAVVSLYFEPNQPIEPYLDQLQEVVKSLKTQYVVLGGDANAWNTWWGSKKTDKRGEEMHGALEEIDLQVLNQGNIPTFDTIRGNKAFSSCVDITACSADALPLIADWTVDHKVTSSDHNAIKFNIYLQKAKGVTISRVTRIYNTKKANWDEFRSKFSQLISESSINKKEIESISNTLDLDKIIQKYINIITITCKKTIPSKKNNNKYNLPWWNDELAALKHDVAIKKHRIRCAAAIRRAKVVREYLEAKENYESKAKQAQIASWKQFCERQDSEGLWDGIYRVIGRTTRRQEDLPLVRDGKTYDLNQSAQLLAEIFYPEDRKEHDNAEHRRIRYAAEKLNEWAQNEVLDPPFTSTELNDAALSFNPKKAPGSDGFTADICQQAVCLDPETFLSMTNKCLELGHFPEFWKEATVIVLRKPAKEDYTNPKAYRPIGLLPVLGKILEKMVIGRIKWHILPGLSTRQFGFVPQKSTEDALYVLMQTIRKKLHQKKLITMISLDIEGAFDSAWWPAIRTRLAEEKCPVNIRRILDSYLRDRTVGVRYGGAEHFKQTSKGCVQGSIGGPILWNLLLDPLLRGLEERGDYCQAFADDVVLVLDGDTGLEVARRANAALAYVQEWGVSNKLKFGPQKTKAMVITNKLKYDPPRLHMGGIGIDLSREIKVLGLTIDDKLTFNAHVTNTCIKVQNIYKQLSRAARVSWGLHPQIIKTIYTAVVEPLVLYAAVAWAPAAKKTWSAKAPERYPKRLRSKNYQVLQNCFPKLSPNPGRNTPLGPQNPGGSRPVRSEEGSVPASAGRQGDGDEGTAHHATPSVGKNRPAVYKPGRSGGGGHTQHSSGANLYRWK